MFMNIDADYVCSTFEHIDNTSSYCFSLNSISSHSFARVSQSNNVSLTNEDTVQTN